MCRRGKTLLHEDGPVGVTADEKVQKEAVVAQPREEAVLATMATCCVAAAGPEGRRLRGGSGGKVRRQVLCEVLCSVSAASKKKQWSRRQQRGAWLPLVRREEAVVAGIIRAS